MKKPLMLMILDGFGLSEDNKGNAVSNADIPNWNSLWDSFPHTSLIASGKRVGLPDGQMGNSEVGHLNLGAGRVVYQELTRISKSIADGDFYTNKPLLELFKKTRENNSSLHLMGLLSDGGVHSHLDHLFALIKMAKENGIENIYIHAFLDGRDVPPRSGAEYLENVMATCNQLGAGKVATVMGRYYAMDRDNRWERTEKAYNAMVLGEGKVTHNSVAEVRDSYENDITDEFVEPIVVAGNEDKPQGLINQNDGVILFNFRADRARQITRSFVDKNLESFSRKKEITVNYCCLTQYDATIEAPVAYEPQVITNTLGEVLSKAGKAQLRIAETEKYAHVTFFFNGGVEEASPGEERILIPSPKVATYDLKPEMSAPDVTEKVIVELEKGIYDVVVLNFANPDMVGHTGDYSAAVKAVETVDFCMGKVVDKVKELGGEVIITADHGNAEQMLEHEDKPHTAHTNNTVPLILVSDRYRNSRLKESYSLEDVAPTLLFMLNIEKPVEMTGNNLIEEGE